LRIVTAYLRTVSDATLSSPVMHSVYIAKCLHFLCAFQLNAFFIT